MLLTTICFLIGAPVQTVCKSIQSGEIYSEVCENKYISFFPSFQHYTMLCKWHSSWNKTLRIMCVYVPVHSSDRKKEVFGLPAERKKKESNNCRFCTQVSLCILSSQPHRLNQVPSSPQISGRNETKSLKTYMFVSCSLIHWRANSKLV